MAATARVMPQVSRVQHAPSSGLISQILAVFVQPKTFFENLPESRQWLIIAMFVLVITGIAAVNQVETTATSSATSNTTQGTSIDLSAFQQSTGDSTSSAGQTTLTGVQPPSFLLGSGTSTATTSTSDDPDSLLISALLSACGVLAVWGGEALLLSLVTMLRGRAPNLGRSLQIAVWASLPLALMLILRLIYFSRGGTGGELGLSLLVQQWDGYSDLPEMAQRVLTVFASGLTLFWLWNIVLLYHGARFALNGRRLSALLVIAMWIAVSTVVPALAGSTVTAVAPRVTETTTTSTDDSSTSTSTTSTTTTTFQQFGGFDPSTSGGFPSGGPPSGGAPPGG